MITVKIDNFITNFDYKRKSKGMSLKEYLEYSLQINKEDFNNLYYLKYLVETENNEKMDSVLKFINTLINLYNNSTSVLLNTCDKLEDLYNDAGDKSEEKRYRKLLEDNSGIHEALINEVYYNKDDNLIFNKSSFILNTDYSISLKVATVDHLMSLKKFIIHDNSFLYPRQRMELLKNRFESLLSNYEDFNFSTNNKIICVAYYSLESEEMRYTVFNEKFIDKVSISDMQHFIECKTINYKGVDFEVWII